MRVIIWFIFYMRLTFVFDFWKILDCVVVPIVLVTVMGNNMAGNKRCFERQHLNMLQMQQPNEVYLLFQKLMKMNIFWHVSSQLQLENSSIILISIVGYRVRQFSFHIIWWITNQLLVKNSLPWNWIKWSHYISHIIAYKLICWNMMHVEDAYFPILQCTSKI